MSQPPVYHPAESSRREVPKLGQHLLTVLQVLVTVGLLWWLFHDPHRRSTIWKALQTADWRWMIAALASAGVCEFLGILRWQLFLKMLHLRVRLGEVTREACAGAARTLGIDELLVVGPGYAGAQPTDNMLAGERGSGGRYGRVQRIAPGMHARFAPHTATLRGVRGPVGGHLR